jgi:uncharacterized repeat protein (TIGR03803 family)
MKFARRFLYALALSCSHPLLAAPTYEIVSNFNQTGDTTGREPWKTLVADSSENLWGVTDAGPPAGGGGTIYKVNLLTGVQTVVSRFGFGGTVPDAQLPTDIVSDGLGSYWGTTFFGTTQVSNGTVFKLNPVTGAATVPIKFTGSSGATRGTGPRSLIYDGAGFLWGVTSGGGSPQNGTVFKVNRSTGAFSTVVEFTGNTGAFRGGQPLCSLVSDGAGNLWGTTIDGGGTIFKINTSTNAFTTVAQFTGSTGAVRGYFPSYRLTADSVGNFWGTTQTGSVGNSSNYGTIFKVNIATGAFTTVKEFNLNSPVVPGFSPQTAMVRHANGDFWGAASNDSDRNGSIFKVSPTGEFTHMFAFTGSGGAVPGQRPLFCSMLSHTDGNLYGTAIEGGSGGGGVLFRVRFGPLPVTQAASQVTPRGATLNGTLNPNGNATTASFQYSTSANFANGVTIDADDIPAGTSAVPVSANVGGLSPNTTYYYCIAGTNIENPNMQRGLLRSFVTPALTPPTGGTVTAIANGAVGPGAELSATFSGWIDADGPLTYQLLVDGIPTEEPSESPTINFVAPATDGAHIVRARIFDTYGAQRELTQQIVVDAVAPTLQVVKISSSNAKSEWARPNDVLTLTFDASEPIVPTVVTIGGITAAVSGGGAHWQASASVSQNTGEGSAEFEIQYKDLVGNPGVTGSSTTDASQVTVDTKPPIITLNGAQLIVLEAASGYLEQGASAFDALAGDVSNTIQLSGNVNTMVPGSYQVTYSARDLAGNTASQLRTIQVVDTTSPLVSGVFAPLELITGPNGTVPLPDYVAQATATDAVGVIGISQLPPAETQRPAGITTVTIGALDAAGNFGSFSFDVNIADGTKPDIGAPPAGFVPATLTTGPDATVALVDYTAQAITSDNVGVTSVTQIPATGTVLAFGNTVVTLTARDAAGNSRDYSFEVPVLDGTKPTIVASAEPFTPLEITTGVDGTAALPDYTAQAVTSDNVGVTSVTQDPPPTSPRLAGATTVKLTAHDAAGNTSSISFDVSVADGTKPEISAPAGGFASTTVTASDDGTVELPDYTAQAVTSDNVGVTSVTQSPTPGSIRLFGKTTVTLTAHDAAGNTRDTNFDVFVVLSKPLLNALTNTSGAVPGAGSDARIPAGATFTSQGIPAIDNARGVSFLGKWKSATGPGAGIFAGNPPVLVVAAGDDAPGIAGAKFKTLGDPVFSPGGAVAFGATVQDGGAKSSNDQGVWWAAGGPPVLMLREGFQVPGVPTGALLKAVLNISLRDDSLLALVSLYPARGLVTAGNDAALLRITAAGATLLLREGSPIDLHDGTPETSLKSIAVLIPADGSPAHGRWHGNSDVIARVTLSDKRTALLKLADNGTLTRTLATGDSIPAIDASATWASLGLPAMDSGGDVSVVRGTLKAPVLRGTIPSVTGKNDTVLALDEGSGAGFVVFAREGGPAPGVVAPGVFAAFQDPIVNDRGAVAFVGTLGGKGLTDRNKIGIWWGAPSAPALLARTGDPAPDGDGALTAATWTRFTSLALPDGENSGPVFLACIAGPGVTAKSNTGVWAVDSTGILRRLLRTGDSVDGKPIVGIHALSTVAGALGASRGFNAHGAIAVRAGFAKGAQSILRIDIPEGKVRVLSPAAE